MLNVGMIVGSTRPNRFADTPVQWLVEGASARTDLRITVLDLRDYRLPFFNEPAPPTYTGGVYSEPAAEVWRRRIGEFDAFVLSRNVVQDEARTEQAHDLPPHADDRAGAVRFSGRRRAAAAAARVKTQTLEELRH